MVPDSKNQTSISKKPVLKTPIFVIHEDGTLSEGDYSMLMGSSGQPVDSTQPAGNTLTGVNGFTTGNGLTCVIGPSYYPRFRERVSSPKVKEKEDEK